MTTELEDRLRDHFRAVADQVADEAVGQPRGDVAPMAMTPVRHPTRRAWSWPLGVAAALAALAVTATVLTVGDEPPAPAATPTTEVAAAAALLHDGRGFDCARLEPLPADVAARQLPDDVRVAGALLPPTAGWCVIDHRVAAAPPADRTAVVWASCRDCAAPQGAAAWLEPAAGVLGGFEADEVLHLRSGPAQLVRPDDRQPLTVLATVDGAVVGWGFDLDVFVGLAEHMRGYGELPAGVEEVYDGAVGGYMAGLTPGRPSVSVTLAAADGDPRLLRSAWSSADAALPLEAYLFAAPAARFETIGGHPALLAGPHPDRRGWRTAAVVDHGDAGVVELLGYGTETPTPAAQLAAIAVTPAPLDDPRWDELAWESGLWDVPG